MPDMKSRELTLREYAAQEEIALQTAYRRVWEGRVSARQIYGRWLISPEQDAPKSPVKEAVAV